MIRPFNSGRFENLLKLSLKPIGRRGTFYMDQAILDALLTRDLLDSVEDANKQHLTLSRKEWDECRRVVGKFSRT